MGRKSKLTEQQWAEIERRLLEGEPGRQVAEAFGINESALRKRFGAQHREIKAVANQIVTAELSFAALPLGAQIKTRTLADRLKSISEHLAGAAEYGAATAHRLNGIAHAQVAKIDDADPLNPESMESLKNIAALTKLANESSTIAIGLLNANKETIKDLNKPGGGDDVNLLEQLVQHLPD